MSQKTPIAQYLDVKFVASDLRDQAIAAFLTSRVDEYIAWIDLHVSDATIKASCLNFVSGVYVKEENAEQIVAHGEKMRVAAQAPGAKAKLDKARDQVLLKHPVLGGGLRVTSRSQDSDLG